MTAPSMRGSAGSISINVSNINDAPVAADDSASTNEDTPISGNVITDAPGVDTDADGDTLTVTAFTIAGQAGPFTIGSPYTIAGIGDLTINSDGSYTFSPAADYNGPVPVTTYTVEDGNGGADTATLTVSIVSVNDAPVANADSGSTPEDTALNVNATAGLLSNDNDVDGDPLSVSGFTIAGEAGPFSVGSPYTIAGVGDLTVNGDGSYSFNPIADFNGPVPLVTYTVSDGQGGADTATLALAVTPSNDAPIAVDDSVSTNEDTPISGNVITDAPGADTDVDGDVLTVTAATVDTDGDGFPELLTLGVATPITDAGANPIGDLTLNTDGSYTFTPAANYNGPVPTVDYTVEDGNGGSDSATLTITVTPVQDAPLAINDGPFAVNEDTPSSGDVLANDSDPDGDPLAVTDFTVDGVAGPIAAGGTATIPGVGTLSIAANGIATFTPEPNYNGPVPGTTYTVTDGQGNFDTARLAFSNVAPVNDPPVATDNAYTTSQDITFGGNVLTDDTGAGVDSDIDGNLLLVSAFTISGEAGPFSIGTAYTIAGVGDLTLNSNGTFTFDPDAAFIGNVPQITYTANDGNGGTADANLDITVTAPGTPTGTVGPVNTMEDVAANGAITISDPDGDPVTASLQTGPANGIAVVNTDGTFSYTPNPDFNGTDTFDVLLDDGTGNTSTVTVNVTVTPVVDIADDQLQTNEDTPVTGNVLTGTGTVGGTGGAGTDSFEGTPQVTAVTQGTNGTVIFLPNGDITYTPDSNFNGSDSFTYTVTSGGVTETATVNVTVDPVNDDPAGSAPPNSTFEDTPVNGTITMTDSDGDVPTATLLTPPTGGSVVVNTDGTYTYTPNPDFNGPDSFTVTIDDGNGGTTTLQVDVTVVPVNDAPDATSSAITAVHNTPTPLSVTLPTDVDDSDTVLSSLILQVPSSAQGVLTYMPGGSGAATPVTVGSFLSNVELATLTFTADPGFTGAANPLIFRTTDDDGASDAGSQAQIDITVVATPPVTQASEPPQTTAEDTPLNGSIDIIPANPPTTTVTVSPTNGTVVITDPVNGDYTYTPNPDYNGPDQFTVVVDDGITPPVTVVVDITVTPLDDPTIAISPAIAASGTDGEPLLIDISTNFTDVDSTPVYNATGLPPWLSIDPVTGIVSGTAPTDASVGGPYTVTVTATDGVNPPAVATLTIDIANPSPAGTPLTRITDDGEFLGIPAGSLFTDPDGDVLTFSSPNLPPWAMLDPVTGVIAGTVPSGFSDGGPTVITIVADDGQGGTATATVTLLPVPVNEDLVENPTPFEDTAEVPVESDPFQTPVNPIVADAVNEIDSLGGTGSVDGVSGIVHDATNEILDLQSTENAGPVDPVVLKAVRAIDDLRRLHIENLDRNPLNGSNTLFETWDVEGLTGFSQRFGYDDALDDTDGNGVTGQLIIETYVRERILFIDVNNTFDPNIHGRVVGYRVEMIDGSDVPDWLRIVRDGFFVAERPADLPDLKLKISAVMANGQEFSRGVHIDGPTGEIQSIALRENNAGNDEPTIILDAANGDPSYKIDDLEYDPLKDLRKAF